MLYAKGNLGVHTTMNKATIISSFCPLLQVAFIQLQEEENLNIFVFDFLFQYCIFSNSFLLFLKKILIK